MKKILLTLSAAALVLASCAKIETVKVDENRAIEFSSFVNKPTKADITNETLKKFWVYGAYNNKGSWASIFTNVGVSGEIGGSWTTEQTAYWTVDADHNFAAYADGESDNDNDSKLTNVTFDAANAALTFNEYTVGENDLVVARAAGKTWDGSGDPTPVQLSFEHMLSKVKFTFTTTDSEDYIYKVSNLQIASAYTVGNGNYNGNVTWTLDGTADGTYKFEDIEDFAQQNGASVELYVIPQSNQLNASFTITAYDKENNKIGDSRNYTVPVTYSGDESGTEKTEWIPGYSYNYTATVTLPQIVDDTKPIEFDVIAVDGWKTVDAGTQNPTPQQ